MQPLKIIIEGTYYDSYIYSGRLYLWSINNSILIVDWDALIDYLETKFQPELSLALVCGFRNSAFLYNPAFKLLFHDDNIRNEIVRKFALLSKYDIVIHENELRKFILCEQENPFPFPHSEMCFYRNCIYTCSADGIFSSEINKRNKTIIYKNANKLFDAPTQCISISYNTIAASLGNDGLYEIDTSQYQTEPSRKYNIHSSFCRWSFYSIYSSSYIKKGYLIDYSYDRSDFSRTFNYLYDSEYLFHSDSFTWGRGDKLCELNKDNITILRYSPWDEHVRFEPIGRISISVPNENFITCESAVFGYIIEYDDFLYVIDSTLSHYKLEYDINNWRVFPRSKFYENHLHLINNNNLLILSFNGDYLVDQKTKNVGLRFFPHVYQRENNQ